MQFQLLCTPLTKTNLVYTYPFHCTATLPVSAFDNLYEPNNYKLFHNAAVDITSYGLRKGPIRSHSLPGNILIYLTVSQKDVKVTLETNVLPDTMFYLCSMTTGRKSINNFLNEQKENHMAFAFVKHEASLDTSLKYIQLNVQNVHIIDEDVAHAQKQ